MRTLLALLLAPLLALTAFLCVLTVIVPTEIKRVVMRSFRRFLRTSKRKDQKHD